MVVPALVFRIALEVSVRVVEVTEEELPRPGLSAVVDVLRDDRIVAVGHPHVPVEDAGEVDEVLARRIDNLEALLGDIPRDEVFLGVGEDGRVATVGALRHADVVAQRTRIVLVLGAVVEGETFLVAEAAAIQRLQELDGGQLVEVDVDRVERLAAVVVHGDNVDGLVPERVDIFLLVGNRERKAVAALDLLRFPDHGGILARAVDIDLDLDHRTEGVGSPDVERRGFLVAGLHGIARNVEVRRSVDDADIQRAAVDAGRIDRVVAVDGAEDGEIDTGAIVGPALGRGVLARNDTVAKYPFEAVDLVGVKGQESHEVDGIADSDGYRVGHGIGRESRGRDGICECLGVLEGVVECEYDGMVVPQVDVFHDGRFPGTAEKNRKARHQGQDQARKSQTHIEFLFRHEITGRLWGRPAFLNLSF